ncbi:unnamed protein product [Lymnaea stagnalis]|uniref:Uncharacterized protein n=1 Tax=Lymnaea stagnalis TaxID=6523 RepID=A0AAV2IJG3_LYMST
MKIGLEVLASTSIKRRKPWSRIIWLGKDRQSLFLLDDKRVSVLYIPSGKTKRNITKLSSLLSETVTITSTLGGLYLVGVQSSGEIFVWHKDRDELKTICGLPGLLLSGEITLGDGCRVFSSPDCSQMLLVVANCHIFLWQRQIHAGDSKNNTLLGNWSKLTIPGLIYLPPTGCKEAGMHAVFASNETSGNCFQLSIVHNHKKHLSVSSLLIRFNPDIIPDSANEDITPMPIWNTLNIPLTTIQQGCEPMAMRGAYVCQYTHDGQLLAIGVNQKSPAQTSVIFVSPFTDTLLVSDLRGCGLKDPAVKRGRQFWIADMSWTSDNLFLAIILRNGSAGLLSRLGEPLVLFSKGCSVEMGPAYFLPFTPLISVQSERMREDDHQFSYNSERDPLQQKFSVSTHPTLPILLYSDGYIVTIAQLPSELSPMIFMRDLVLESSSHLRQIAETVRLDLTLANAYNLPAGELESVKQTPRGVKQIRPSKVPKNYSFEEASQSMNETLDSEVSCALGVDQASAQQAGAIHNMSSGKIVFGEPEVLLMTEGSFLNEPNSTMKALQLAKMNLFNVWKLAASTSELWSPNLDKIVSHTVHNIVKLFSLVLDCPQIKDLLEGAGDHLVTPSTVTTQSLFKVISMYKQLLDLLQFDCQQRHLLASVLQLAHKTLIVILSSVGLCDSDPRLKTLTGCFTLLKFTEKTMVQNYISLPRKLTSKGFSPSLRLADEEGDLKHGSVESAQTDVQMAKRLTSTWKLLHKAVLQFLSRNEESAHDMRQAQTLQSAIQQCLIELDVDVVPIQAPLINSGERFSLDGKHTLAMNAWQKQLKKFQEVGNVKNAARLFHSLLYTYILRNDLTTAVSFVDTLIAKANSCEVEEFDPNKKVSSHNLQPSLMIFVTTTLKTLALDEPDMVPCIRDRAIRQVVQSMGRFMAAYFTNQMVFIFPPHNPTPLPAVHFETSIANSRIIPKYHEDIATIIRHQKLGSVWTVERTLEYLLLSGLLCEATWFADRMGDWKSAYQLSVSHTLHKRLAVPLYASAKKPLILPEWLNPDAIMKRRLERLVKEDLEVTSGNSDLTHLTKILEDIALAGVMGYTEVGSWLLGELVGKLKAVARQFTPLVTKDFYLPAPPLYCPQPARTEKLRVSLETEDEMRLREKASSIIQLALCVMNATHMSIPAVSWYVQELEEANKKSSQFKANTEGPCANLPDVLYQFLDRESEFHNMFEDRSVKSVLSSFRDLCSLVWLLHARDKLSMGIRSRERYLGLGLDVENNEQWLRECFSTLQWAVHMVAFSHYLPDEASIYKVVLSLLLDLPATEDTANILAEHMYDLENLHPEVQERLDRMLKSWQGIILRQAADGRSVGDNLNMDVEGRKSVTFLAASPRGMSLSVYFHKQCMVMDKVIKKKSQCFGSFEEFVFTESHAKPKKNKLNIGSLPFETKKSYIEFLDTFVAVSFSKVFDMMEGMDKIYSLPMLQVFAKDIVDHEITFFVQRAGYSAQKKNQSLVIFSGASQTLARAASEERLSGRPKSKERSVPGRTTSKEVFSSSGEMKHKKVNVTRPVGLFRGKSMIDAPVVKSHAAVRRFESEPSLDDLDMNYFVGSQVSHDHAAGSRQNLSSLASRFGHSVEDVRRNSHAREQERTSWSLTVNFGKKYKVLHQLVEWLEVWSNKSHALGIPDKEEILDIQAKMRIRIPAQLIILSLWLLENKYSKTAEDEVKMDPVVNKGRRSRRLSKSPHRTNSLSPPNRQSNFSSEPEMKKAYQTHAAAQQSSKSYQPQAMSQQSSKARFESPDEKSGNLENKSAPLSRQSTLENDEIINAYTQALDGQDESSSIDISSLASDEMGDSLKTTLNMLRGSVLGQTIQPKDASPERAPQSSLLKPKDTSTPIKQPEILEARSPSLSPPLPKDQKTQSLSGSTSKKSQQSRGTSPRKVNSAGDRQPKLQDQVGGIAGQLQGIIRDELRRIMEVQHRSVLAMMGAIDGISPAEFSALPIPSNSAGHAVSKSNSLRLEKDQKRSELSQPPTIKVQQAWTKARDEEESESLAEMLSLQDEMVPTSPLKSPKTRKREKRSPPMREALVELQNLQRNSSMQPQHNLFGQEMSSHARFLLASYPQQDNGRNLRLPFLHVNAWPEQGRPQQQHQPVPAPGLHQMSLLHINKTMDVQEPFSNLRRYLPQVPPPPPFPPQSHTHKLEVQPPPLQAFPSQSHGPQGQPPQFHWPQGQPLQFHGPQGQHPQSHGPLGQPPQFHSLPLFHIPPSPAPSSYLLSAPLQQKFSPPPYEHKPHQSLRAPPSEAPPAGLPFLKLLPLGVQFGADSGGDKLEETRRRLLRKFQEEILADKENSEKLILGQQMLRMEAQQSPLESARSERSDKSRTSSVRTPSQSLEQFVQVSEKHEQATSPDHNIEHVPVADAATSDTQINDGFALPRGVFESYLQLGEQLIGPEANQTSAAFQLRMAMAMQRQVEKRIRAKVDFSTMTQEQIDMAMATDPAMEVVRTAEAATSITKDTGVDPIQEALNEYNIKQHNNILPPDIFMGLRFADQNTQTRAASEVPGQGRSYLNVVDIRASSILRDIPEHTDSADEGHGVDIDSALMTSLRAAQKMEVLEESLREKLAPRASVVTPQGYDSLTVKMFEQLRATKDDRVSIAVMPRSSVSEPKSAMIRRLRDMSDQLKAIDEMSQNIERDFKSSHLLLSTIQDVNASIQRSRSPSPDRSKFKREKEIRYSMNEEEERGSPTLPSPKTSIKSPKASARSVKSRSTVATESREAVSQSESELTDLIAEVLAQSGADLQTAGFSQEIALQLERDTREKIQKEKYGGLTPRDKLISMERSEESLQKRSLAEKEKLKQWMTEKYHQRQDEYKRRRSELIEREPKPFKSLSTVTRQNLKTLEAEHSEKRIHMASEFMNQRLIEAEHLMGSIMVDQPDMSRALAFETKTRRLPTQSPKRPGSTSTTSPSRHMSGAYRKSRSPIRKAASSATWSYKPESSSRSPQAIRSKMSTDSTPVKSILKGSGREMQPSSADLYLDHPVLASISEVDRSVDSSADLISYAKHVLEMDSQDRVSPTMSFLLPSTKPKPREEAVSSRIGSSPQPSKKSPARQGKSYAEVVRMQRPEATRKWKEINRQRQILDEEERLTARQEALNKSLTGQNSNLFQPKSKDLGTKQIPGSGPSKIVPRRVKTYSERLQEMKPGRKFSAPVSRKPVSARTTSTAPRSTRRGPPQKLKLHQKAAVSSQKTSQVARKTFVPTRTFLRSHGPLHKPKTYAEQLHELNPHPHPAEISHSKTPMHATVTVHSSGSRNQARARPYNDPYSDMDYEEIASVLSGWEMDENVHNIIYGGSTVTSSVAFLVDELDMSRSGGDARHFAPSENQSDYFDAIMRGRQPFRSTDSDEIGAGDYRTSVDIHEIERIADAASVGSGSVLSVIDWDAIEDLIRDV